MQGDRIPVQIDQEAIDLLLPLHIVITRAGEIVGCGRTMMRVMGGKVPRADFFDIFTIEKPRNIRDVPGIQKTLGKKLTVSTVLSSGQKLQFRCVACAMATSDRLLIDYSFGENLSKVITEFSLTTTDFKPNDFSIDMLFMLESQKALLEDSRTMAEALSAAKERAETAANVDLVTGIANRRAFGLYLDWLIAEASEGEEYALLNIDLDKFKAVNDAYGHAAGDLILRHTAEVLKTAAGPSDFAARLGGDEFALVLREPPGNDALEAKLLTLLSEISKPVRYGEHLCQVGASIGVNRFQPAGLTSPAQPLAYSDIALYAAKERMVSHAFLTPDMVAEHTHTADLIQELKAGISDARFLPYFQPQIDVRTGAISGVEVLARWRHPVRGILTPAHWIAAADSAGLMSSIDHLVMSQAIGRFCDWRARGLAPGKLSFNLTLANLRSEDFIEGFVDTLMLAGISTSEVRIELLESILFDTADQTLIKRCFRLHDAGFQLALDDFGTGHSSIATLIDMPISIVKIDRSFVTGLDQRPKLQQITKSILAMSSQIGLDVIAEGIETEAELAMIKSFGCRYVQGYYFSRPLDAETCATWIADHTSGQTRSSAV